MCDLGLNITDCEVKLNYVSDFGYKAVFSRYYSLMEEGLIICQNSLNNATQLVDDTLGNKIFDELSILNYDYLRNTMNLWSDNLFQIINSKIDGESNLKVIILALLLVFIGVGYLAVWVPFQYQLRENVINNIYRQYYRFQEQE